MKKSVIILLHVLFWDSLLALLILFGKVSMHLNEGLTAGYLSKVMLGFVIVPAVVSFYLFYFYGFNKFLKKRRILPLILMGIGMSLLAALDGAIILSVIFDSNFMFADGWYSFTGELIMMELIALFAGLAGLILRVFIEWYGDLKVKEELTRKNHETELALVKSQLDPHFLFNTINNIDVLIKKDGDRASEYLNKLSDIMRFMLYETKTDEIALVDELKYIEKYLELQRIRTSNPDYVKYTFTGDENGVKVAPMLFIPFIENAFKHATNKKTQNAIRISVDSNASGVTFECVNHYSGEGQLKPDEGGVGMELIRKRLQLMYPEMHELSIDKSDELYSVTLKLNR